MLESVLEYGRDLLLLGLQQALTDIAHVWTQSEPNDNHDSNQQGFLEVWKNIVVTCCHLI